MASKPASGVDVQADDAQLVGVGNGSSSDISWAAAQRELSSYTDDDVFHENEVIDQQGQGDVSVKDYEEGEEGEPQVLFHVQPMPWLHSHHQQQHEQAAAAAVVPPPAKQRKLVPVTIPPESLLLHSPTQDPIALSDVSSIALLSSTDDDNVVKLKPFCMCAICDKWLADASSTERHLLLDHQGIYTKRIYTRFDCCACYDDDSRLHDRALFTQAEARRHYQRRHPHHHSIELYDTRDEAMEQIVTQFVQLCLDTTPEDKKRDF